MICDVLQVAKNFSDVFEKLVPQGSGSLVLVKERRRTRTESDDEDEVSQLNHRVTHTHVVMFVFSFLIFFFNLYISFYLLIALHWHAVNKDEEVGSEEAGVRERHVFCIIFSPLHA